MIANSKSKKAGIASKGALKASKKPLKSSAGASSAKKATGKKAAAKDLKPKSSAPKTAAKVAKSKTAIAKPPKVVAPKGGKSKPAAKKISAANKAIPKVTAKASAAKVVASASKPPKSVAPVKKIAPPVAAKSKLAPAAEKGAKDVAREVAVKPPFVKEKKVVKPEPPPPPSKTSPTIVAKIRDLQNDREKRKDFAQPPTSKSVLTPHPRPTDQPRDPERDRLVLMVRDPFWLHAFWDITRKSVERAKASLAGHWHTARPVLRLLRNEDNSTTSTSENVYKDIEIHGGVRHWYIEIDAPSSTFRLLVGYLYSNNRFHELARSNPVTPPVPGSADSTDDHWADLSKDADRVYALSGGNLDDGGAVELQQLMQEKLKRPVGNPSLTQFGSGAEGGLRRMKNFHLDLDAEMVIFGNTHPSAILTVGGDPISVRSDGSYSTRVPLPNSRQVLTVTSRSRDGLDEQTVVIAVERNTKVMEPLSSSDAED